MNLTLGIDDAGRGPIIGPMILAGVLIDKSQELKLKKMKVRDSKKVPQEERLKFAKFIKENSYDYHIVKVFPIEIDNSLYSGTNLNTLEAKKAAEIINKINSKKYQKEKIKVILDCPSINTTSWLNTLISFIQQRDNLLFVCEHKADVNHVSVSAASIIAKVVREEEVFKLKSKYGEIGSGYPSDPFTQKFLKKYGKELSNSGIFRKSWQTWKDFFPEEKIKPKDQKSLSDF